MFEDKNVLNMLAQYNEVFKDDPSRSKETRPIPLIWQNRPQIWLCFNELTIKDN